MSINTLINNPVILDELKIALNSGGGSVIPINIQAVGTSLIIDSNNSYKNGNIINLNFVITKTGPWTGGTIESLLLLPALAVPDGTVNFVCATSIDLGVIYNFASVDIVYGTGFISFRPISGVNASTDITFFCNTSYIVQ